MTNKELITDAPANKRTIMVAEMEPTLWIMFETFDRVLVKRKEQVSQVGVISYVEFLLKNGLAFDDINELNEYEEDFLKELAESYRLSLYN